MGEIYDPAFKSEDFASLPKKTQMLYQMLYAMRDRQTNELWDAKNARALSGAGDDDVRLLIRKGYVLVGEFRKIFVVINRETRERVQEYIEENGCAPTVDEVRRWEGKANE